MHRANRLKRQVVLVLVLLLISFSTMVMGTFAWYIYQTSVRTSSVHMAVGTGTTLQISKTYGGEYSSAAVLDEFHGTLNPVSTDRITGGFQRVLEFKDLEGEELRRVASIFGASDGNDYYHTELFLRCSGEEQNVYLSDIGFEDDDPENPISTAIRVGFVVHEPGENTPVAAEYIFAINTSPNPGGGDYNTEQGEIGHVLDSSRTDGATVPMDHLFTPDNYCDYDPATGRVDLRPSSLPLTILSGGANGDYGTPVRVEVYIWLEGCDEDCNNNLCSRMLDRIALSFACKSRQREG